MAETHDLLQLEQPGESSTSDSTSVAVPNPSPPDLVLIVFIHGFKGGDDTFAEFPQRLQHLVETTVDNVVVESVVFPAYETKGELVAAVERFIDWLVTTTVEKEVESSMKSGATKAKVVLCGHSMGGLVAVDALLSIAKTTQPTAPLWPKIVACIAFDTPYYGLNPFMFKQNATKAVEYFDTARKAASAFNIFGGPKATTTASASAAKAPIAAITAAPQSPSAWSKWAPVAYGVGGALVGTALAGTAYMRKDDINVGYQWATDHMKYVGTLWDKDLIKNRMQNLEDISQAFGVEFRNFYTLLPPKEYSISGARTFIVMPEANTPVASKFVASQNYLAEDEVQAHMHMFEAKTNDGYYALGLSTTKVIEEAMLRARSSEAEVSK